MAIGLRVGPCVGVAVLLSACSGPSQEGEPKARASAAAAESGASKPAGSKPPDSEPREATPLEPTPPEPTPREPTPPAADPRWACTSDDSCIASCRHGAVAKDWYAKQYPGGEACEDGCTSKGTEAPVCREGQCIARRFDADDPGCTATDNPVIEGPGPAHRCTSDTDCTNDCAYGAVNRAWFEALVDPDGCKDGCTSKGTEAARCEDGRCVAYRLGKRDASCTGRSIWRE